MKENNRYNKQLQPFANKLRKTMTKAEACLWKYALSAELIPGCKFRRQRPVLNFIADFACLELKLIIEVDGITHMNEAGKLRDENKNQALSEAGYTVLRFTDSDVLKAMPAVKQRIYEKTEELRKIREFEAVHPLPPPAGDTLQRSHSGKK